jgi:hypothetical protein
MGTMRQTTATATGRTYPAAYTTPGSPRVHATFDGQHAAHSTAYGGRAIPADAEYLPSMPSRAYGCYACRRDMLIGAGEGTRDTSGAPMFAVDRTLKDSGPVYGQAAPAPKAAKAPRAAANPAPVKRADSLDVRAAGFPAPSAPPADADANLRALLERAMAAEAEVSALRAALQALLGTPTPEGVSAPAASFAAALSTPEPEDVQGSGTHDAAVQAAVDAWNATTGDRSMRNRAADRAVRATIRGTGVQYRDVWASFATARKSA